MSNDGEQYVIGWEREQEKIGGIRGGLPPRRTMIPVSPIHAVLLGGTTAVCGAHCRHVDDTTEWPGGSIGRCRDCRTALA